MRGVVEILCLRTAISTTHHMMCKLIIAGTLQAGINAFAASPNNVVSRKIWKT